MTKRKPAREALPAIWMVVNGDSTYVYAFTARAEAVEFARWRPKLWEFRIVRYIPAPSRRAR